LRLGRRWPALLRAAGQPQRRGRAWSWCVRGGGADIAELTRRGRVELVGSTAPRRRAGGVAIGATELSATRRAARGIRYRRTAHGAWAYRLHRGRVVAVATASRSLARRPRALAAAMRRLTSARARTTTASFEPSPAQRTGAVPTGRPLAGTGNTDTDAALALLCQLQVSALAR
jgi:hypothetical protein